MTSKPDRTTRRDRPLRFAAPWVALFSAVVVAVTSLAGVVEAQARRHDDACRDVDSLVRLNQATWRVYLDKGPGLLREAQRAVDCAASLKDPAHLEVAQTYALYAAVARLAGTADQGEPALRRAVAIATKAVGEEHPETIDLRVRLAATWVDQARDLDAAQAIAARAYSYFKSHGLHASSATWGRTAIELLVRIADAKSENAVARAMLRIDLARVLWSVGKPEGALRAAEAAASLFEAQGDSGSLGVGLAEQERGTALASLGDVRGAQVAYSRALGILRKQERGGGAVAKLSIQLGTMMLGTGDEAAIPLFRDAIAIHEKEVAAGGDGRAQALERLVEARYHLARALRESGDLAGSERVMQQNRESLRDTGAFDGHAEAIFCGELALVREDQGRFVEAIELARNARSRFRSEGERSRGNSEVVDHLLIRLLVETKAFDDAEAILRARVAEGDLDLRSGDDFVLVKLAKGDLAAAAEILAMLVPEVDAAHGPGSYERTVVRRNLAAVHVLAGHPADARAVLAGLLDVERTALCTTLPGLSERERLLFAGGLRGTLDEIVAVDRMQPSDDSARLALETVLQRKGLAAEYALTSSRKAVATAGRRGEALRELQAAREDLARRMTAPASDRAVEADVVVRLQRIDALEKEVGEDGRPECSGDHFALTTAIQRRLGPGAALVEVILVEPAKAGVTASGGESPYYMAYVLRSSGPIRRVELGVATRVDELVRRAGVALAKGDPSYGRAARALDELVMRPIRAALGEVRDVWMAPDGALDLVPFAALVDEEDRFLVSRYRFTYLTSGRALLGVRDAPAPGSGVLVVADPDYGEPGASAAPTGGAEPARVGGARFGGAHPSFTPLPGTADEAKALRAIFPSATLLTGRQATEDALRIATAPRVLHVATHGFFLRGPAAQSGTSDARRSARPVIDPLLRSGLALAGANVRREGDGDGVLTALEVAGLNLHGTQLVVLSACDTGVGEVMNGEGVFGLRRALVIAGAETQVVTLWRVADAPTRRLMVGYYEKLARGRGRSEAMRQTQLEMLAEPATSHPFFWAPFIVSGDARSLDGAAAGPVEPSSASLLATRAMEVGPGARGCRCAMPGRGAASGAPAALALLAALVLGARRGRRVGPRVRGARRRTVGGSQASPWPR